MAKAYDRVSWNCIMSSMRCLGFDEKWCDLVFRCISNCYYSVKWDGNIYGFFKSIRGVRQGDPLSPALFTFAMEWMSRALNHAVVKGDILPYCTENDSIKVNHLLFADDLLIFTSADTSSVTNLLVLLGKFCEISGQQLNPDKSLVIFSEWFSEEQKSEILSLTGFMQAKLPIKYLGTPLFRGRVLTEYFTHLEVKLKEKVSGWAKNFLSMGGRVTLVNSVLNSIGIHCMMVLPVPTSTLNHLVSTMSSFIWNARQDRRKHWISWERLCKPKECGGLGIRDPKGFMIGLHGKLAWSFIQGKTLWARYARSRFQEGKKGSALWNSFNHLISSIRGNCTWKIGRGDTLTFDYMTKLGLQIPSSIPNIEIRSLRANSLVYGFFVHALPEAEKNNFKMATFSNYDDELVWKLSDSTEFSVKKFWESFQTRHEFTEWSSLIWKSWIPTKVACFIWKLFQNVVPTDDRIRSVHIPITSRCVCCTHPSVETTNHLFFKSEWASKIWGYLSMTFDRPRVYSMAAMTKVWLKPSNGDYIDCLASGLAMCGLWELWKARNKLTFEGKLTSWLHKTMKWGPQLAQIINRRYIDSMQNDLILKSLGIYHKTNPLRGVWHKWPHGSSDLTCNFALLIRGGECVGGAVIRNSAGALKLAVVSLIPRSTTFEELVWFGNLVLKTADRVGAIIGSLQSSHQYMSLLQCPDHEVPNDFVCLSRLFHTSFPSIQCTRICPKLNGAAIALVCTTPPGEYFSHENLPTPVIRAINSDAQWLPSFCAEGCYQSPHLVHNRSQDDISIRRGDRYIIAQIHDDSSV